MTTASASFHTRCCHTFANLMAIVVNSVCMRRGSCHRPYNATHLQTSLQRFATTSSGVCKPGRKCIYKALLYTSHIFPKLLAYS
jgi:hypothetical protein